MFYFYFYFFYSLQPDTVPQACIDMTSVVEVQDADEVTGHPHSLAITDPDRVTFVKGNCSEEGRRWSDVLSVFPRSKVRTIIAFIYISIIYPNDPKKS